MALPNKSIIMGYLTRDTKVFHTKKGTPVSTFELANDRPYKNRKGDDITDYPVITLWGKQAETLHKYAGKGSLISITGRNTTGRYKNRKGRVIYFQNILADRYGMELISTKRPSYSKDNNNSSNNTKSSESSASSSSASNSASSESVSEKDSQSSSASQSPYSDNKMSQSEIDNAVNAHVIHDDDLPF